MDAPADRLARGARPGRARPATARARPARGPRSGQPERAAPEAARPPRGGAPGRAGNDPRRPRLDPAAVPVHAARGQRLERADPQLATRGRNAGRGKRTGGAAPRGPLVDAAGDSATDRRPAPARPAAARPHAGSGAPGVHDAMAGRTTDRTPSPTSTPNRERRRRRRERRPPARNEDHRRTRHRALPHPRPLAHPDRTEQSRRGPRGSTR